jgi:hypothetical protein
MKLYNGFVATGPEVRWYPPSPARGRPQGFYDKTGRYVTTWFVDETFWFGCPEGITMCYVKYKDQRDEPMYEAYPRISFSGQQRIRQGGESTIYEDVWDVEDGEIWSTDTDQGYVEFRLEKFETSFQGFCKSMSNGTQMLRKKYVFPERPPFEPAGEWTVPDRYGEVS